MAKQRLFHVVKRTGLSLKGKIAIYFGAVILALGLGAVLLIALGADPLNYYKTMVTIGLTESRYIELNFENLIKIFVPLLMTSTALSLAFKMKFWNIGGEAQFISGSLAAGFVALWFGPQMNFALCLLCMMLAGMLAAGLIGAIVAWMKVRFRTNETLFTLMLNYIFLYLLRFFGETKADWNLFLSEESLRPTFARLEMPMPTISIGEFDLDVSLLLALFICVLMHVYMRYTKHGYEIAVVGDSQNTARYAGMKVGKIVVRTMFLSAALIGLAGACKVSTSNILSTAITGDVGWTGIIVAWLARLNTWAVLVVSLLISVLQYGCQFAASHFRQVDAHYADILQGIILFFVLAADFLIRFRIVFRKESSQGGDKE